MTDGLKVSMGDYRSNNGILATVPSTLDGFFGGVNAEITSRHPLTRFSWDTTHLSFKAAPDGEPYAPRQGTLTRLGWRGSRSRLLGARPILSLESGIRESEGKLNHAWTTFTIHDSEYVTEMVIACLRAAGVKPTQAEYGIGFGST